MSEATPFAVRWVEETSTLHVSGDIELEDAQWLGHILRQHKEPVMVVDVSGATLMPSFVVGVVLTATREARHEARIITLHAEPTSAAHRALTYMGLLDP